MAKRFNQGYTVMELVMVIVLLGLISAIILPRINLDTFQEGGFFSQVLASIRYAQKQAISTGCGVTVEIDEVDSEICELKWNGCASNTNLINPGSGEVEFCPDSSPVGSVPTVNFSFDRIGVPSAAQSFSIGGRTITVEANTGFTHE
jgi:MSHA pilin protein MshC